jgi:hypothetical protein
MLIFLSIVVVIALICFAVSRTPPLETLYRCIEDGERSALYLRRVRRTDFWGNCGPVRFPIELRIEEFRRITCAAGQGYVAATSDWYTRTRSEETSVYLDNYAALSTDEGHKLWHTQMQITRKVAKRLRKVKHAWQGSSAVIT